MLREEGVLEGREAALVFGDIPDDMPLFHVVGEWRQADGCATLVHAGRLGEREDVVSAGGFVEADLATVGL